MWQYTTGPIQHLLSGNPHSIIWYVSNQPAHTMCIINYLLLQHIVTSLISWSMWVTILEYIIVMFKHVYHQCPGL